MAISIPPSAEEMKRIRQEQRREFEQKQAYWAAQTVKRERRAAQVGIGLHLLKRFVIWTVVVGGFWFLVISIFD